MASLPAYLRVVGTERGADGIVCEIEVLRWHPAWWAACWREARSYVGACVELEIMGRPLPALWHPVVLWRTLRATLSAIVGSPPERIAPEAGG